MSGARREQPERSPTAERAPTAPVAVRAEAPAKVNLRLEVLGRRPDGYHAVATALVALDLCDGLRLRPRREGPVTLAVEGPAATADVPTDGRNLARRAAVATLAAAAARGLVAPAAGCHLELYKRVPSRAGLGGGSADAAAAALAVEAAFGFELPADERADLLAALGSDVPFFAVARDSGYAWCFGRGERVRPLELPRARELWFALVVPTVEAPTAAVYAALGLAPGPVVERQGVEDVLDGPFETVRAGLSNGLERAALSALPELAAWRVLLEGVDPGAYHLCGSGGGWFSLHADEGAARTSLAAVEAAAAEASLPLRLATAVRARGRGVAVAPEAAE